MKKMSVAALLIAGMAMASAPALAQDSAAAEESSGDVVAVVNGSNIDQSDLVAFIQQLPPQIQAQVQLLMPQIIDQLVNNELTTQAGRAAGLAEDAEVQLRVAKIQDLIIGQTYLQRQLDERLTDAKIDEAYQEYLKENPPQQQLKARHILVETEEQAKEVIAALDGGADFAELAKEKSTGPSGANGGELPPFGKGDMVPAFEEAAFAMEVGTHSKEPVKTQFGFHVIKLEDSTLKDPPAKAELEDQLRDQLAQQAVEDIYAELRDGAEIDVLLGKPKAEEAAPMDGAGEAPAAQEPASESSTESETAPANN